MKGSRCRLYGGGRKLAYVELKERLLSYIHERLANLLRFSRTLIMFKIKSIYDEKCGNKKAMKDTFMSCNNLLRQRKTTIAQKDPSHVTGKFVGYVMHVRRLTMKENYSPNCVIPMDEAAV